MTKPKKKSMDVRAEIDQIKGQMEEIGSLLVN
jgi:hypothetical protein